MDALTGFRDFLPSDRAILNYIFARWREVAQLSGFLEWDGPVLEPTDLYRKKSGDEIVAQLFNFIDKGEREVAMRPELTPSLARVIGAHERAFKKPLKWFSIGQFFRYEKPQRGRLREHYQLNCDIAGESDFAADVELIALCIDILRGFGLTEKDFVVRISDREFWTDFLKSKNVPSERWDEILQVIDKAERADRAKASEQLGSLAGPVFDIFAKGGESSKLDKLMEGLRIRGLANFAKVDVRIVRGLAYYTGIVFEVFDRAGKFRAIAGGGRYDNLIGQLSDGAASMPALGFAMGDVVLGDLIRETPNALELMDSTIRQESAIDVYVIVGKEEMREHALEYVQVLRDGGYRVAYALSPAKLRNQFEAAEQVGARVAVLLGDEWPDVKLKTFATGEQRRMSVHQSLRWLARLNPVSRNLPLLGIRNRYTNPSMDVEVLALCDAATAHAGKMNILGIFSHIHAPDIPVIAPPCSLAVRIRFMKLEEGQKALRIAFVDADGKPVLPTLDANVEVRVPPNESSATAQIVLGIQQLKLPQFGEYAIDLAIDGRVEKSIPLYARKIGQ